MIAARFNADKAVQLLLDRGADIEATDSVRGGLRVGVRPAYFGGLGVGLW